MTAPMKRRGPALAVVVLLVGGAMASIGGSAVADPVGGPNRHDGRFVFARIRYTDGYAGGGFAYRQDLPWAHDYPTAERNLMRILESITLVDPYMGQDGGVILMFDDPNLFRYPFAYMSEPGYWSLTEAETVGLRNYLLKGGFLIFDDFHGDLMWFNMEEQMRKVFPDLRWIELDATHPVYHSFFDIDSLVYDEVYRGDIPIFFGLFEDNDPNGRLLSVANHNNDIGDSWEWADTGWISIDLSNEAFKLGVNYIMYALTH
ncbi:MAG TPA: DUF4159 domain-containing protein [Vicinamibacterales bacterium]|nr:DUF4159 domain-containing protein [Vicinamibacterales bacterium]HJN46591.1 DUF4159 domain-containing protein [Vicinamibacterales bacterium]